MYKNAKAKNKPKKTTEEIYNIDAYNKNKIKKRYMQTRQTEHVAYNRQSARLAYNPYRGEGKIQLKISKANHNQKHHQFYSLSQLCIMSSYIIRAVKW